ncbi:MAG: YheU family protein [Candidatus Pelagadaptatus aseana]|uniref:YheU family protein n=1 Tax=Candidatus Pelagadaptatus aseana TaxID=3120508 RepID=UPI0039B2BFE2
MAVCVVIIPYEQLSSEALNGLVEEFITREGTDYGLQEISLTDKVAQVLTQIKQGDVVIVFDAGMESVSLMTRLDARENGFYE